MLLLFQFKQSFVADIFSSFQVPPKPTYHFSFSHTLGNFSATSLKHDCLSCLRSCSSGSAVLPVEESCLHPPNPCLLIPCLHATLQHQTFTLGQSPSFSDKLFLRYACPFCTCNWYYLSPDVWLDFLMYIYFLYIHTHYTFVFVNQSHCFIYEGKSIVGHLWFPITELGCSLN